MGRCLAAVVVAVVLAAGGCKKKDGTTTGPAAGDGETAAPAGGGGEGGDEPGGADEEKGGGGGPMGPAEFCKTYGEMAKKEGGKTADFFERNYGKDCVKRLTAEQKKKGGAEKWSEFVSCTTAQPTAAEAFDACEL
jgi:hypothetical protein